MPPLLVFHSARPLPARLAAAVYLGRLPARCPGARDGRAAVLARLGGGPDLLRPQAGLRHEGVDRWGRPVYSTGPGTNPAVLGRALAHVAGALGVPPGAYCLVPVPEHPAELLVPLVLGPDRALAWLLGLCWPAAARAAAAAARAAAAVAPGAHGPFRDPAAPPEGQPAPPDDQPAPVVGSG